MAVITGPECQPTDSGFIGISNPVQESENYSALIHFNRSQKDTLFSAKCH